MFLLESHLHAVPIFEQQQPIEHMQSPRNQGRTSALKQQLLPYPEPLVRPTRDRVVHHSTTALNVRHSTLGDSYAYQKRIQQLERQVEDYEFEHQANLVYNRQWRVLAKIMGDEGMEFEEIRDRLGQIISGSQGQAQREQGEVVEYTKQELRARLSEASRSEFLRLLDLGSAIVLSEQSPNARKRRAVRQAFYQIWVQTLQQHQLSKTKLLHSVPSADPSPEQLLQKNRYISQLASQLQHINSLLLQQQTKASEYQHKYQLLQHQHKQLTVDNEDHRHYITKLKDQLNNLELRYQQVQHAHTMEVQMCQHAKQQVQGLMGELQELKEARDRERREYMDKMEELERGAAQYEATVAGLQVHRNEVLREVWVHRGRVEELEQQLLQQEGQWGRDRGNLEVVQGRLEQVQGKLRLMEEEAEARVGLKGTLTEMETRVTEWEMKARERDMRVQMLVEQIGRQRQQHKHTQTELRLRLQQALQAKQQLEQQLVQLQNNQHQPRHQLYHAHPLSQQLQHHHPLSQFLPHTQNQQHPQHQEQQQQQIQQLITYTQTLSRQKLQLQATITRLQSQIYNLAQDSQANGNNAQILQQQQTAQLVQKLRRKDIYIDQLTTTLSRQADQITTLTQQHYTIAEQYKILKQQYQQVSTQVSITKQQNKHLSEVVACLNTQISRYAGLSVAVLSGGKMGGSGGVAAGDATQDYSHNASTQLKTIEEIVDSQLSIPEDSNSDARVKGPEVGVVVDLHQNQAYRQGEEGRQGGGQGPERGYDYEYRRPPVVRNSARFEALLREVAEEGTTGDAGESAIVNNTGNVGEEGSSTSVKQSQEIGQSVSSFKAEDLPPEPRSQHTLITSINRIKNEGELEQQDMRKQKTHKMISEQREAEEGRGKSRSLGELSEEPRVGTVHEVESLASEQSQAMEESQASQVQEKEPQRGYQEKASGNISEIMDQHVKELDQIRKVEESERASQESLREREPKSKPNQNKIEEYQPKQHQQVQQKSQIPQQKPKRKSEEQTQQPIQPQKTPTALQQQEPTPHQPTTILSEVIPKPPTPVLSPLFVSPSQPLSPAPPVSQIQAYKFSFGPGAPFIRSSNSIHLQSPDPGPHSPTRPEFSLKLEQPSPQHPQRPPSHRYPSPQKVVVIESIGSRQPRRSPLPIQPSINAGTHLQYMGMGQSELVTAPGTARAPSPQNKFLAVDRVVSVRHVSRQVSPSRPSGGRLQTNGDKKYTTIYTSKPSILNQSSGSSRSVSPRTHRDSGQGVGSRGQIGSSRVVVEKQESNVRVGHFGQASNQRQSLVSRLEIGNRRHSQLLQLGASKLQSQRQVQDTAHLAHRGGFTSLKQLQMRRVSANLTPRPYSNAPEPPLSPPQPRNPTTTLPEPVPMAHHYLPKPSTGPAPMMGYHRQYQLQARPSPTLQYLYPTSSSKQVLQQEIFSSKYKVLEGDGQSSESGMSIQQNGRLLDCCPEC